MLIHLGRAITGNTNALKYQRPLYLEIASLEKDTNKLNNSVESDWFHITEFILRSAGLP